MICYDLKCPAWAAWLGRRRAIGFGPTNDRLSQWRPTRLKDEQMDMRRVARNRTGRSSIAPVEMPGLDNHLCFALYAASNHMTRLFVPFLKKLGVTYPQYLVLVVLWERGAQGVGEMASALQMDLGTLSPMLKRLEAKGLVTRRRQATDERRVLVDLTAKGVSLRKRTEQMLGEFYCFLNMPLDELFDLKDQLRHFVSSAGPKETKATAVKLSDAVS